MPRAVATGVLHDRELEIDTLAATVDLLAAGSGSVVLVEGAAGIGKTALLRVVRSLLSARGVETLSATGGPFERNDPYGVTRQLFERRLRSASAVEEDALLAGAARLARDIVCPQVEVGEVPASGIHGAGMDSYAATHSLYWLVDNLATRSPVALIVDDAHWCDPASLRFLLFLARRISDLQVGLFVAIRRSDSEVVEPLLAELSAVQEPVVILRPAPLSADAVAELLASGLEQPADPQFAGACWAASGGVPFLVHAMIEAFAAEGVQPTAQSREKVSRLGVEQVAVALLRRLAPSPSAVRLAEAVAVLGDDADLAVAGRLAGLDARTSVAAADRLSAMAVFSPDSLRFTHPIVRLSVYSHMSGPRRAWLHRQAAGLLAEIGSAHTRVGAHLLAAGPSGTIEPVAALQAAARESLMMGAPEDAARLLEAALREPVTEDERAALALALGRAQVAARDPAAVATLRDGLARAPDPVWSARLAVALIEVLVIVGSWAEAFELNSAAVAAFAPSGDVELLTRLRTTRLGFLGYDPVGTEELDACALALAPAIAAQGAGSRAASVMLLGVTASRMTGRPAHWPQHGWADLSTRALDITSLIEEEGLESPVIGQFGLILVAREDLERLRQSGRDVLRIARQRGSPYGVALASTMMGVAAVRSGDLVDGEQHVALAAELAVRHRLVFLVPSLLHWAADLLVERPLPAELGDAYRVHLEPAFSGTISGAMLWHARGVVHRHQGQLPAAVSALRLAGELFTACAGRDPLLYPWRSELAHALLPTDRTGAMRLATAELELAEERGGSHAVGSALHAVALAAAGSPDLERLGKAIGLLADSPARIATVRALVDLGAALRRGNQRAAAREPLRRALDLARRCGALRSAERARRELAATGARVVREAVAGVESLTPSQRRVAELAAAGRSNPEIAQALFVSRNTVETHLRAVFARVGVQRREDLAAVLDVDANLTEPP